MSDRLAVFNRGRIEQVGPPAEVYEQPLNAFVAGFVGVSNLLERGGRRFTVRPEKVRLVPYFSRFDALNRDPDGNANFNGIDFTAGRNAFTAPAFVNVDLRFSKRFSIGERIKIEALFEFFNLLNRQNPSSIQNRVDVVTQPFGSITQVLPGREGQIRLRVSF